LLREGKDSLIISIGTMVHPSLEAARILSEKGIDVSVINARFIKPIDKELILKEVAGKGNIFTVEENSVVGGLGDSIQELLNDEGVTSKVTRIGIPDRFIAHGKRDELLDELGLTPESIAHRITMELENK